MSHFVVLVIGDNVEQQLAPYHEFECTGTDDEYVKDIDVTEEYRAKFEKDTDTVIQAPDGMLHSFFDGNGNWRTEFSQPDPDAASWDKNRRTRFVPEGYQQIEVPSSRMQTFAQWCEGWGGQKVIPHGEQPDLSGPHKYGYVLLNEAGEVEKVIDRTNPNKKWDWYAIGGRWTGYFTLKPDVPHDPSMLGEPGAMTKAAKPGTADVLRKGDIDFVTMRDEAGSKAEKEWDRAAALHNGERWVSWTDMLEKHGGKEHVDVARALYAAQSPIQRMKADKEFDNDHFWDGFDEFLTPRDDYVQQARDRAIVPYAVVYKGEWSARGEMGWFGMDTKNIDQSQWNRLINELIDGLPDDTRLTVVDCHI